MQTSTPFAYGKIANAYDAVLTFSGFRRGVENFLDRIELSLPPSPKILDAGCGTGLMARYLLRRFPDARIVASDIDPSMLKEMEQLVIKEGLPKEQIIIAEGDLSAPERMRVFGTGREVAVAENYFDGIFVSGALEHVPLGETVRRLAKLLRPGGIFFNLGMRRSPAGAILGMMYGVKPYRIAEMRGACDAAGLADVRVLRLATEDFPANLSRIAIIAKRK
ncbi:MAG: class I SAM-dependent methyltransferase [bacterium]|nr:class I SAM-dependent methyltransferase [bacterium]